MLLMSFDMIVVFCLLNVWQSIEQCVIEASTDQWHARLKADWVLLGVDD